ncbi:hypothetical protein [Azotobacter beijerinckii]|uniref:hypothetical protein n=1 Tax=Azotobacter beijerinckii TaxID=170623 RepID=UPI00147D7544|nr:hypothetical protein [Azotobacter beijerinckii]
MKTSKAECVPAFRLVAGGRAGSGLQESAGIFGGRLGERGEAVLGDFRHLAAAAAPFATVAAIEGAANRDISPGHFAGAFGRRRRASGGKRSARGHEAAGASSPSAQRLLRGYRAVVLRTAKSPKPNKDIRIDCSPP